MSTLSSKSNKTIRAAPGGLRLTHWVSLDSQNHRTTVQLANQRYGVAVADSAFTFRDPRLIQ